jgi:hypothetical protein
LPDAGRDVKVERKIERKILRRAARLLGYLAR